MWKRYLSPTPANVARLMIAAKTILVTCASAEFMAGKASVAFYIMIATGILNEAANFLTNKKDKSEE